MVKVSVWITTYNHEKFIAKALDSALMQKTEFDYEIIIGEDFSTDNTRQIVLDFKEKYPDKIRLFLPEKNLGMILLSKATYGLCTGEYIAWLDGDDYWTDSSKLQKQVDFLEENLDFVVSFHNVKQLNEIDGTYIINNGPPRNDDDSFSILHLLKTINPIHSSSVVHRNILGNKLPEWVYSLPYLDLALLYLLLEHGKFKYINDVIGVYRKHVRGEWSGKALSKQLSSAVIFYQILLDNLDSLSKNIIFTKKIQNQIAMLCFDLLIIGLHNENYHDLKSLITTILKNNFLVFYQRKRDLFNLLKSKKNVDCLKKYGNEDFQ